jgi:hypothetical protein
MVMVVPAVILPNKVVALYCLLSGLTLLLASKAPLIIVNVAPSSPGGSNAGVLPGVPITKVPVFLNVAEVVMVDISEKTFKL